MKYDIKKSTKREQLSASFNKGAQSLDEATVSAKSMVDSLKKAGVFLERPKSGCSNQCNHCKHEGVNNDF